MERPSASLPRLAHSPRVFRAAVLTLAALGCLSACASHGPYVWVRDLPAAQRTGTRIEPRDTLVIAVDGQAPLSGEFPVREDGCFLHPAGNICVAGQTPEQAAGILVSQLKTLVVAPKANLWVARPAPIKVSVVGEVKTPGAYELGRDRGVMAALAAAGWLNDYAQRDAVFVIRQSEPQRRIRFRVTDLTRSEPASANFRLKDGDAVVVE